MLVVDMGRLLACAGFEMGMGTLSAGADYTSAMPKCMRTENRQFPTKNCTLVIRLFVNTYICFTFTPLIPTQTSVTALIVLNGFDSLEQT